MRKDRYEIDGFSFSTVSAGIKRPDSNRPDFALIYAEKPAVAVGVTTTNLVCAAPVIVTRQRLLGGFSQAVLINSGNANAFTGESGIRDSLALASGVAELLSINEEFVIPMSTGVIGHPLPLSRMRAKLPDLTRSLHSSKFEDVASAIMTTDTKPKIACSDKTLSNGPLKILGMAKGAGMIAPNMATMLAVIIVDALVERSLLRKVFVDINRRTFNRLTIDGDTSTNDTALVLSGGSHCSMKLKSQMSDEKIFSEALFDVCSSLAYQIVKDGEGATKVVEIIVKGAASEAAAEKVARRIAESPLVKTAFHGEDPNWGRIVCAAGSAGISFDPSKIDLWMGAIQIVRSGNLVDGDWETPASEEMGKEEFSVTIDLKKGPCEASVLTCDLSKEYVEINADYRS
ncbi:MAG: bifunctional glutamate N-acetyltransferase/amino-acid acetyltransferase ArgJ [Pseudomonadota bacterium]